MSPSYQANVPIYLQIMMQFKRSIVAGEWQPGDRVPPVRELASTFEVNPNTMQRAMMEMEREELVYSQRTAGRFVTEDGERIRRLRESLARNQVKDFLEGMYQLGFQLGEIVTFVQTEGEKGHHEHSGV